MNEELVKLESSVPSVAMMLQTAIEKGVSASDLEKLCGLYERMQDRDAEKQFNAAFCELQKELPAVQATKAVPNNDGSARYKFAPYAEIMKQVQPMLSKHGFSVRFTSKIDDAKVTMSCTLAHVAGHSVANEFTVRIGKGPPGSSDSQADGSAASYAQRGALCDALNIVVRTDDDARLEGAKITCEQARSLQKRVERTVSNQEAFLRYAGAEFYDDIPESKYEMLDTMLKRKEKTLGL